MFRGRALLSVTPGPEWAEHSDPASLVLDCSDIAVEEVSLLCGDPLEVGDGGKLKPVHCSFSITLRVRVRVPMFDSMFDATGHVVNCCSDAEKIIQTKARCSTQS